MPALWMEFGQDPVQSPQGGLQLAYGADQVRQAICRELLTTPALTLDDGTTVQAEYILDPTFGVGLRVLIGQLDSDAFIAQTTQKITNCVLKTPGVNASIPPTIQAIQQGTAEYILISYQLANGSPSSAALQIGGTSAAPNT
jgi:hypothetical protein